MNKPTKKGSKKTRQFPIIWILIIFGIFYLLSNIQLPTAGAPREIAYSDFYNILKDNPETKDIPIVFLTAIGGNIENKLQSLMVGGVDYIQKPFDGNDLMKRIEKILKGD